MTNNSLEKIPSSVTEELANSNPSANFEIIKKNIADIKNSVNQVKLEKETLEKEKSSLAKEVLAQKEQALETKKVEIETKKKETLALITKVKIDAKLVALDQQVSAEIDEDEKYLNTLDVSLSSLGEKQRSRLGKQYDAVLDKQEWKDHTMNNVVRVAAGVGAVALAWKGVKRLFGIGKDKDKQESESSDGKKEEKTSWWKKALMWTGIGAAGTWLGRGLLTGKWDLFGRNPFSKDKKDGPELTPGANLDSSAEAYQSLSEEKRAQFESLASNINTYYGNAMGDQAGVSGVEEQLGDSEFEQKDGQKIAGLVPFVLNNRYASVSAMLDEKAFYYEILGTEGHIVWDQVKNLGVDGLKTFLMPVAGLLDTATLNILKTSNKLDDILNALKSDPKAESVMRTMFRKSLSVMSYMESRKRKLDCQIAREYLTAHNEDNFNTMDEDDKLEKIADMLDDDDWYAKNVAAKVSEFMQKGILDATGYLKSKNLLDGEIDPLIQKAVAKVEDKRKDLLGIEDEDDESTLQLLKAELKEGKLSPKGKEKLVELCNTFEYDIDNFGKKSWYNQYLPILELMNVDQDTLAKMQSTGDYDGVVKVYKDAIQSILKKSNNGTLTSADLDNLEAQINDYYKFQKSLVTTQLNLSESRDQNGNIVSRWVSTCVSGGETIVRGIQLVTKDGIGNKLKGVGAIAGGVIALDLLTGTLITKKYSPARFVAKHILYPVGKGTLKFSALGVEKLTGKVLRNRLPYGLGAKWFDEHSLRVAVCEGEIDLDRAAKVAHRKEWKISSNGNSKVISTAEDYLQSLFPGKTATEYTDATNLLKKYKTNSAVYQDIFKGTYDNKKFFRPKDWFKMDNKKMIFDLDTKALQRLKDIDIRIEGFTNPTEKTIFRSMMKSAKNLDQAESLVTMSIEPQYLKLFESGSDGVVSAEKFGTYLAKYGKKMDANEMKAFQKFLSDAKGAGKMGSNSELFVRNTLRNFDSLKAKNFNFAALSEAETLKLSQSKWYRVAEETKASTGKMISKLSEFAKNPRLKPFWKGMNNQIVALKEYAKTITPEGMKAIKDMKRLDNVTGFSKLSEEGMQAMSKISYILRDVSRGPVLLNALKSAKNVDEVKAILSAEHGIDVAKIDDTILAKLASTKNVSKMTDIVHYGAEFKAISGVKKLISNPSMKFIGKMGGKALVGLDFAMTGYDFYTGLEESQEIKKSNLARGEWREDQAYFDVVSGGLGAIAGACMFIPGAGWIAGGAMFGFMAIKEMGDKYYEDIAKFKQNYADFSRKELPAIKQELVSINAWGQGIDRTWIDKMSMFKGMRWAPTLGILGAVGSNSVSEKEKGLKSTTTDAVKALLYVEEMQNYPAASYDLNSPEVLNNPDLKAKVEEAKRAVDKQVKKRFEYIQLNYIAKGKSIVDAQAHNTDRGIAALDTLLQNSSIYTIASADTLYKDKNNIAAYVHQKEEYLKQLDASGFAKLESLYKTNQTQLFLMYAQAPSYKAWLLQTGDSEQDRLLQNIDFFMQYMAYKTLGKSPLDFPKVDLNPSTIDYVPIHDLLSTFTLSATTYSGSEIASRAELLTDKQVLLNYGVSTNLGQNILYDIAKTLDYSGPNDLSQLKRFYTETSKTVHGIYCTEEGQWRINENNGLDNDFAKDDELNSLDKMQYFYEKILDASSSSFTGKMIEESGSNNRELAKRFSNITNSHLILRKNKSQIVGEIKSYLLKHGNAQNYISLPLDLMLKGTKAGISGLASCVYRIDNGKILYKTTISGAKPGF